MKPLHFYPSELVTIGDHLRKKRLDLKLFQKDVAEFIGATESTVYLWEANRATPSIAFMPKIIEFLGYVPYYGTARNLGERIRAARVALGLSQEELARQLGIDPSTIRRWESDKGRPSRELLERHFVRAGLQDWFLNCLG